MVTQVIPGFRLAEYERAAFERQPQYTGDVAKRISNELAEVLCRHFPGADRELLAKQIESDYLEWASQTGRFIYRRGPGGRPTVSPERRAELAKIAQETKTRWGLR